MRILWNESARRMLGHLSGEQRETVESETRAVLGDAVPGDAKTLKDGTMFVLLPCGHEVVFERIGDGVQVIMVVGAIKNAAQAERDFLRRMTVAG